MRVLTPCTYASRHDGDQRLLRAPPRLQEAGEGAAAAQLGNRQVQRPQARVPRPRATPMALRRALLRPLVALGADLGPHLRFHQLLQQPRQAPPQEVVAALPRAGFLPLAQQVQQGHPVFDHRVLLSLNGLVLLQGKHTVALPSTRLFTPPPGTLSPVALHTKTVLCRCKAVFALRYRRPVLLSPQQRQHLKQSLPARFGQRRGQPDPHH